MPQRAVNAFGRLAPDQRAAVELVLRGRSYAELASLLGIAEETVRERAHGGLEALAPDLPPPARAGEVADFLLGQGGDARDLDAGTRRWAETVAAALGDVPGASVPDLPSPAPEPARPASDSSPAATGRSSRLGGAILIGAAVIVVALVLAYVLTRGDDSPPAAETAPPAATATATNSSELSPNDIVLRGPAGSQAVGVMRLVRANDNTVRFVLAAQDVTKAKTYTVWFEKEDGSAQRLGAAAGADDGTLALAGPRNEDVEKFPQWFASYDTVVVSEDASATAKEPGKVILSGDLPSGSG